MAYKMTKFELDRTFMKHFLITILKWLSKGSIIRMLKCFSISFFCWKLPTPKKKKKKNSEKKKPFFFFRQVFFSPSKKKKKKKKNFAGNCLKQIIAKNQKFFFFFKMAAGGHLGCRNVPKFAPGRDLITSNMSTKFEDDRIKALVCVPHTRRNSTKPRPQPDGPSLNQYIINN